MAALCATAVDRRSVLRGLAGTTPLWLVGCLGDGGPTDGGSDDHVESRTPDPARVDVFTAALLSGHDVPSEVPVSDWETDLRDASIVDRLASLATDPSAQRFDGRTREIEFEFVQVTDVTADDARDAIETLADYPRHDDPEWGYPQGWYVDHPDELLAISYAIQE